MVSQPLLFAAPLLLAAALVNAAAELSPIPQLQKRNPYYGGYALSMGAVSCPASTEHCQGDFCCPANTWCGPAINGPYCCPTADDCGAVVGDAPTCADPSWSLYMDAYAFCCTEDKLGIQGEQCQPKSLTFSEGAYAATSSQANTALPPATRSGATTTAATGTATGTATTTGGGVGGVLTSLGAAASSAIGKSDGPRSVGDAHRVLATVGAGFIFTMLYALY